MNSIFLRWRIGFMGFYGVRFLYFDFFKEAKPYITYGTRVVDLDSQRIFVNMPDEELDNEAVPTPIVSLFRRKN